eukprot:12206454-Heterocapsa_arctica.AAC.1
MVIARALPDSPAPPEMLIVYVFSDPLDGSGSKCRCASDGVSGSSSSNSRSTTGVTVMITLLMPKTINP